LAVPGVRFFHLRRGQWYAVGEHLPQFGPVVPGRAVALDQVLGVAPLLPTAQEVTPPTPLPLRWVPSTSAQPTTAALVALPVLAAWAETALSAELAALGAAWSGTQVWLHGPVPWLAGAERFWGRDVWQPLGWRADPDWAPAAWRQAVGAMPDDWLILTPAGAEVIPKACFAPLTRASVRLALQEERAR
jgi:hypothetical protein